MRERWSEWTWKSPEEKDLRLIESEESEAGMVIELSKTPTSNTGVWGAELYERKYSKKRDCSQVK